MPRVGSEQYAILEEATTTRSTGTSDVKTIVPTLGRAIGVWVSVETTNARMTFGGTAPGAGTGPGVIVVAGAPSQFFPFPFEKNATSGGRIRFAAASAGNSDVTPTFVI